MARLGRPLAVYAVLAGLALAAACALPPAPFERFLPGLPPVPVLAAAALAGALALAALEAQGWTRPPGAAPRLRILAAAMGIVALCAAAAIAIDLAAPFPRGMNVPSPQARLFYPAIAVLVEIVFHLVPLALVWSAANAALGKAARDRLVLPCLAAVALLEPAFQIALSPPQTPLWVSAAVGLNVLVINLVQLAVFRRCGFAAMLAVRLAYYLLWHILWGELRLAVLF
ncbi:MAG: hypothetical protein U1F24_01930 [Alphaproteobacteria bacterium]